MFCRFHSAYIYRDGILVTNFDQEISNLFVYSYHTSVVEMIHKDSCCLYNTSCGIEYSSELARQ